MQVAGLDKSISELKIMHVAGTKGKVTTLFLRESTYLHSFFCLHLIHQLENLYIKFIRSPCVLQHRESSCVLQSKNEKSRSKCMTSSYSHFMLHVLIYSWNFECMMFVACSCAHYVLPKQTHIWSIQGDETTAFSCADTYVGLCHSFEKSIIVLNNINYLSPRKATFEIQNLV